MGGEQSGERRTGQPEGVETGEERSASQLQESSTAHSSGPAASQGS